LLGASSADRFFIGGGASLVALLLVTPTIIGFSTN
jgi:hypothetical protein